MSQQDEQTFLNLIAEVQAAFDAIANTEAFKSVMKHGWISDIGLFVMRNELDSLRNRYLQIQEQIEELLEDE
ncbi:hypothetical protein [Iningainema tapete]|uniref:Uncharacterized protein n=1 Tax=Iningainema tapete BLCC-T55 TaxID=2748662 RepID=A0A8J6XCV5_9CYAN|nr:hypothetical protein [Iningainema tapete]MBD2770665.1 hypothetical protein [Iningainema tapete BLCC-T55]